MEHGPNWDDEINLLVAGANYGWDPADGPGYNHRAPMTDLRKFPDALEAKWSSEKETLAISGGIFLDDSAWGAWNGRLAVAALKAQSLNLFEFDSSGTLLSHVVVPELHEHYGRLRTPMTGPDGALYVTTSNGTSLDYILKVVPSLPPQFSAEVTTQSVEENRGASTVVATVTAIDPEGGAVTYTLGGGEDARNFNIANPDIGEVRADAPLDYETKSSYTVDVIATDPWGLDDAITLTINVENIDELPEFPSATMTRSVAENTGPGVSIGAPVTATTVGAAVTYTLGGTDAASFDIVEATGQLQTKAALDYETRSSYEVTVTATNLEGSVDIMVTIDVTNVIELQPLAVTTCSGGMAGTYPCRNVDLMSFLALADIGGGSANDVWGWTDSSTGKEYAIMGRTNGTSFVDISDPVNPIYLGNLPPHSDDSTGRDIKVYADHAFIVTEANNSGMQVFDLTQLRMVASPPATFSETAHYPDFSDAHNLAINEESGFAYAVGTNTCSGGLHMINIQTPTNPTSAACFSGDGYTHDAQCVIYDGPDLDHKRKEICFNSNEDTLTIVDVTNKAGPVMLSRTGYSGSRYAHQGWLTEDQVYFLLGDELDEANNPDVTNTRTYMWDVSDLDDPALIGSHDSTTTAIDHNQYVKGNYTYQSNYQAGLRILDITDIANGNLSEAAFFDVNPGSDPTNTDGGTWSNYPFFDSGIVIVSVIEQGLFILRPNLVDGVNPALSSASVNGAALTLTYGEALDEGSRPAPGDFTVQVDGSGRSVSGVSVSGRVVTLTLASVVAHDETVTVSYSPGANPIRDAAGNGAIGLSNEPVANETPETALPNMWLNPTKSDPVASVRSEATYTVTFQGAWNTTVTAGGVPSGGHFTTLIGGVHNAEVTFLKEGGMATAGVEIMAELGGTGTLTNEVRAAEPNALSVLQGSAGNIGPTGSSTINMVTLTTDHPRVTLLSMVAPSPDWFVGVSGLSLLDAGADWLPSQTVNLYPWDAGTEEGTEFSLTNSATSPQEIITSLRGIGKFSNERIATLTFTRQSVNTAPSFTGDTRFEADENQTAAGRVAAADPDSGDGVTYAITGGADASKFGIGETTGVLTFQVPPNYERAADVASADPVNGAGNNEYIVTVTATGGTGDRAMTTEQTITATVRNVEEAGTISFSQVGSAIRARLSDPDGGVNGATWQWARSSNRNTGWTHIGGATSARYTPSSGDQGMYLQATVSYDDAHSSGKQAQGISATQIAPPNLRVATLVSGLSIPWDIAFTPDGTMLFTQRAGVLSSRLADGTVQTIDADFGDLFASGETGLMGIVVDPAFVSNRRFYTCQGHTGPEIQVIAWTLNAAYTQATRVADPLVGGLPASSDRHGGCRLRFGPEGYLWIATGDAASGTLPQDLTSLGGKVLRVDASTGAGAPTNPFAPSRVYTYGHRNVQGLALRPGTSQMWSVEHGPSVDDEINRLVAGRNYGWNPVPGYNESVPMTDLVEYPDAVEAKWSSGSTTRATSGGIFLEGNQWGVWEGRLAVATLADSKLRLFEFTPDGAFVSQLIVPELNGVFGRLRTPMMGPDGALYVSTSNGGSSDRILRIAEDDPIPVTLKLTPASIGENGGVSTVTASQNRVSITATTVTVSAMAVNPAVPGDVRLSVNKTLTITAGQTSSSGTVTLTANNNTADTPNKTVRVSGTATNSAGVTGPSDVTLTIIDDDDPPTVTLDLMPTSIGENGGSTTVTARLNRTSSETTTVTVSATAVSPAVAGDFALSAHKTLTITAGQTTSAGTVTITANNNDADTPNKTVRVHGTADNSHGVTVPDDEELTITDDDDPPTVTLRLSRTSISENGGSTTVTARLDRVSSETTTVNVSATAVSPAVAEDLTVSVNKTLTILEGQKNSTGTVTITANNNDADTPNKTVRVHGTADNSHGVTVPDDEELTITDDDAAPVMTLEVNPTVIAEAAGNSTVTVRINNGVAFAEDQQIALTFTGTASKGTDYTVGLERLTLIAGQSSTATTVTAVDDALDDEAETVRITARHRGGVLGAEQTITITDDDASPVILTNSTILVDENETAVATLTASDADRPAEDLTWRITGGADRNRFRLTSDGVLTFAAAQDYEVPGDSDGNGDYEVAVEVHDGANPVEAVFTIRLKDVDDTAPVLSSASVNGASLTLTYGEALDPNSRPAASDFTVAGGNSARTVSNVAVSGRAVTLTLDPAVEHGETGIRVSYTPGTRPIQDAAGNDALGLSNERVTNNTGDTTAPTVSRVETTSRPERAATYAAGQEIAVTVTFSETVVVTGTPRLRLNVGGVSRTAAYRSGTGAAAVFVYVVADGESDTDGVSIEANSLTLNGGRIRDGANNNALLTHDGLAVNAGHKVDGVKPALAANGGAVVNGTTLTLTFGERLDGSSTPQASAFTVTGGDTSRTVTDVALSGSAVLLTVDPAVEHGETGIRVSYTVPTGTGSIPLQDVLGNDADRLSNVPVTNETPDTTSPTVSKLEITSDPGTDRTYAAGDEIRMTVTFSEPADVERTPRLMLKVGDRNRPAGYLEGTGTTELVFGYEVADRDEDTDGVSVEAGRLTLNGGTIRDGSNNNAVLDHDGLAANSGHKVDGAGPDLAETGGAVVNGTTLTLTYDEALDGGSTPAAGDFTVAGGDRVRTVTGVRVSGSTVELTLNAGAEHLETGILVSYTPGMKPIRDVPGNEVEAVSREPVRNDTPDTSPPKVESVAISSNPGSDRTYAAGDEIRVTATFSETVKVEGTPQLRLRVGTRTRTADYLRGTDTAALVFGYEVVEGDEDSDGVSIEASRIALNRGAIKDEAENSAELAHGAVAPQAGHTVDGVRPAFVSAAVDGSSLTLTYGEALDGGSRPASGDFTVQVDGAGRSVTGVSVSGRVVTLTLNPAVEHGDTGIRVSYTVPTGVGANPIQDAVGNDARGLNNQSVTNTTGAPNTGPEITTQGPLSVGENQALVRRLAARDTDPGDEVTGWEIVGGADRFQFSVSPDTGELSFQTPPDYEDPTDEASTDPPSGAGDNEYVVTVEVRSGAGVRELEAEQTFTIRVTDEREPPEVPEAPTFSGETADSLRVNWSEPDNTGPEITDYDVQYREKGTGRFIDGDQQGPGRTLTLEDLEPGTVYEVQVRAKNDEGTGDWSESGEGMTVTPLTVVMASDLPPPVEGPFTVRFSFSEPVTGFGGSDIETGQDPECRDDQNNPVFCDPGIGALQTTDDRVYTATVTPQTGGVAHSYTVRLTVPGGAVRSSVGSKPNEEPEEPLEVRVAPPGVTEPISSIGLGASSGSGSVRLSWNLPSDNGGSAIIRYEVRYQAVGEAWSEWENVGARARGVTVGNLVNGREYVFEVRAVNALGKSGAETVRAVPERRIAPPPPPPPGNGGGGGLLFPPEAPAGLMAMPGDGAVRLEWSPPESDGGTPILRYEYRLKEGRGEFGEWTPIADSAPGEVNASGYVVEGLGKGTVYVFELRGVNLVGNGPESEAVEAVMGLDRAYWSNFRAGDLQGIEASLEGGPTPQSVRLRFGAGLRFEEDQLDGEGEVTETRMGSYGYRYTSRTTGELSLDYDGGKACELRLTFRGVGAGSYRYRCGGVLGGQGSFRMSGLNRAPEITGAGVFEVAENTARVGRVEAVDGDDEIGGYGIAGGADGGLFAVEAGELMFREAPDYEDPSDVESAEPASGAADNEYIVVVEVRSGEGERELKGSRAIRVRVADEEEPPGAPGVPAVTAEGSDSLKVSWREPENRGPEITDYEVRYREGGEAGYSDGGHEGRGLEVRLSGLEEGTVYEVQVRAVNEEGISEWSEPGEGRTDSEEPDPDDPSDFTGEDLEGRRLTLRLEGDEGSAKSLELWFGEGNRFEQIESGGEQAATRSEGAASRSGSYAYEKTAPLMGTVRLDYDDGSSCEIRLSFTEAGVGAFAYDCGEGDPAEGSFRLTTGSLFVPVILSAAGRNNSFFTSELTLTNRGEREERLDYLYTAHIGGGSGRASEVLAPGVQKIETDALGHLRGLGIPIPEEGNRIGTLRVEARLGSEVEAVVRTTTVVPEGRAGLAYPGVAEEEGFSEVVYLCGLRQNAQDRSNVAFQNMGAEEEGAITLKTTVYSGEAGDTSARDLGEITLEPGGFHQYSGLLGVLESVGGNRQGYVKVERVEGRAPFYAYGVINDQANSDGSFVFPVTASSLAESIGQTLPVIVETSEFTSELTVTNFSEEPRRLDFQFVAEGIEADDKTAVFSMRLEAGQQHLLADVVEELRRQRVAGLGSTRGFYAGPLFVAAEGGDMSGIVIGARTGSQGGGGSYSVFYNAVPEGGAFAEVAWVDGLQQNEENRSNLALVNTGEVDESPSVFHLEIYDGETGMLAEMVVTKPIPARRWHQINGILGSYAPETRQGYIRIEKVSGENPFLAYGVVNDGGAPGERSGDGAYLPARE